jgi:hypothetical protein
MLTSIWEERTASFRTYIEEERGVGQQTGHAVQAAESEESLVDFLAEVGLDLDLGVGRKGPRDEGPDGLSPWRGTRHDRPGRAPAHARTPLFKDPSLAPG